MIDYDEFRHDEDFMTILGYLRRNCIACEDEAVDGTDLDFEVVRKHFSLAQAIVAEEIDIGVKHDPEGAAISRGFMEYLRLA